MYIVTKEDDLDFIHEIEAARVRRQHPKATQVYVFTVPPRQTPEYPYLALYVESHAGISRDEVTVSGKGVPVKRIMEVSGQLALAIHLTRMGKLDQYRASAASMTGMLDDIDLI
jgi:hypothetical protein